jgi:hypothetical protein
MDRMSIVSDFATRMAAQAFPMIGAENVTIGSATLSCVLAEADNGKDFSTGGFETVRTLQAVCRTSAMPTASILKKVAVARGVTYRVESVRAGATFTTISLEQAEKS